MSKRLVLFSQPTPNVFEQLKTALFPEYLSAKVFAYMPSDGTNTKYNSVWQQFVETNGAQFVFVNNSKRGAEAEIEAQKILSANILLISGGNTFTLLNHLKLSSLDETIKQFWQKDNIVLSGFSAGAIVLSPSIETAKTGAADADELGITDLTGLNIIDFEVWPHYEPDQESELKEYQATHPGELKTIGDEEVVVYNY